MSEFEEVERVSSEILLLLAEWVGGYSKKDKQLFRIGDRPFSLNELLLEIGKESEIGMDFLSIFIEDIRENAALKDRLDNI